MGFQSNVSTWATEQQFLADRVEQFITGAILNRSKMLAPVDTGLLVASGRIERLAGGGRAVVYGDSEVPYARRRHFENNKNPQTLGYLQRAGDSVAKENIKKYVDMAQ